MEEIIEEKLKQQHNLKNEKSRLSSAEVKINRSVLKRSINTKIAADKPQLLIKTAADSVVKRHHEINEIDDEIITDTAENGTQTKFKKGKQGRISPLSNYICFSKQMVPTEKPKKRKVKLMSWKKYHRLNVIYAFLDDLERDYPAICTVSVIGRSVEGRSIKMLKVSNSDATNHGVWMDGCIHPREWISTSVVTFLADHIVKHFHELPAFMTNKDWYIVPVLNPDGYEYTHTTDRMWRKNRAYYGGERVGVDLNRNFSFGWGKNGDEGSSDEPKHVFYRGPEPFSEPESIAVRDTILGTSTNFKVFLSFHSYFEMIIFPWGHRNDPCPDYLRLLEAGAVMARAIYESSGITYKVGSTKDMTYDACGTSTDWSYGIAKIPYSFMIELRSKRHRFRVPKEQIMDTCVEILCAVKSLMDHINDH